MTRNEKIARFYRNVEEVTAWDVEVFYTARFGRLAGPLEGLMREESFKDQIKVFKGELVKIASERPEAVPSYLLNGDKFDVIATFVMQINEFIKMVITLSPEELDKILKAPTIH